MRGRPIQHENQEVVNKAQQVFWEKGYSATSLSDLNKVTGLGAGSLYNSFKGGKKEIFRKAILQRREAFSDFKNKLSKSERPLELIKEFFRGIATASESDHKKGCIIANTVVEMTFIDNDLENEAISILKDVEIMFSEAIAYEQKKGFLKIKLPPEELGRYLMTFWCGLNTLRRVYPDKEILLSQIEIQLAVLS